MKTERIEFEGVYCDFCNEGADTLGCALVGSKAVCGDCVQRHGMLQPSYPFKSEIEVFDQSKTFEENVKEYRKKVYGDEKGFIEITS